MSRVLAAESVTTKFATCPSVTVTSPTLTVGCGSTLIWTVDDAVASLPSVTVSFALKVPAEA